MVKIGCRYSQSYISISYITKTFFILMLFRYTKAIFIAKAELYLLYQACPGKKGTFIVVKTVVPLIATNLNRVTFKKSFKIEKWPKYQMIRMERLNFVHFKKSLVEFWVGQWPVVWYGKVQHRKVFETIILLALVLRWSSVMISSVAGQSYQTLQYVYFLPYHIISRLPY